MKIKSFAGLFLVLALLFSSCSSSSNLTKGTAVGAGSGALLGAGIGAIFGGEAGAAWGAGIGAVVGGSSGALIGNKMDKQKKELEQIKGASVETVNEGQAIKVTFESGILFNSSSSELSPKSKTALTEFAESLNRNPDTDIRVCGYTDNTGSDAINNPLSDKRAQSVQDFLLTQGINYTRIDAKGFGSSLPVADNSTKAGRAQNRRVEVYIFPNTKMIEEAKAKAN